MSSGSARRRARERRAAEAARADCECLARESRDRTAKAKLKQCCSMSEWAPWGRAGGGAPNASVRLRDVRLHELFPEDEMQVFSSSRSAFAEGVCARARARPRRRGLRTPRGQRVHANALLRFEPSAGAGEMMRRAVDNDIRYRLTREQQLAYKTLLDELVTSKKKAVRDETKRDMEFDKRMCGMKGPWGWAGPGGAAWRNPRDIGTNFLKSMGWTDERTFGEIQGTHKTNKHVTLPKLEQCAKTSENVGSELSKCALKLPPIQTPDMSVGVGAGVCAGGGGVELVPLLAQRRRRGARTLPSSDVTRRQNEPCQWRTDDNELEYLKDLNNQIRIKLLKFEESRKDSAEKCLLHQETWSGLWGRPGHGAPRPGHLQRNNLLALLYDTAPGPLPPLPPVTLLR